MLIPFSLAQVGPTTEVLAQNFEILNKQLDEASSLADLVVSLESALEEDGYSAIMNKFNKDIVSIMGPSRPPLSLGYSILLYFTIKVSFIATI